MDGSLSQGVIVSSNRFNDVGPYSSLIYEENTQLWGEVFPWEFPQNANREEEERFLRRFFSDSEIHRQGGADGPGNGFRFLKQVWYSNALWNLEHRVPAVEAWYWQQEDSMIHLNDPKINEYFFKPDVTASTFFKPAELDTYGHKFLKAVIPRIQRTAKAFLDKQQAMKPATSMSNGLGITGHALDPSLDNRVPKSAPSGQHEFLTIQTNSDHPVSTDDPMTTSSNIPQSAPLPPTRTPAASTVEQAGPQITDNVSNELTFPPDQQIHQRQRGNSGVGRFNNRSGSFHSRQTRPFVDRDHNLLPYSSPIYGPHPALSYPHPRGPSGGPVNFMPAVPQGQLMPGMPPQMQYMPGQVGQDVGMLQSSVPHPNQLPHGQQPIYYSNDTFRNQIDVQFPERGFNSDRYQPVFDDHYAIRGGHRRDSQGSRGGKPRGFSNNRGRGYRGRNSFTSSNAPNQPPVFAHANQRPFDDFQVSGAPFKGRRGSVIDEKTWRSGSDHPQIQRNDHAKKENIAPGRDFSNSSYHAPVSMALPNLENTMRSSYQQKPGPPMSFDAPVFQSTIPAHGAGRESLQRPAEMQPLSREMTCGMDWIGAECTFATKLVVFNVPEFLSQNEILQQLIPYGRVKEANRAPPTSTHTRPPKGPPLVFIQFSSHLDARTFLNQKPSLWLDNRALRVEVSREYWDPTHWRYHHHHPSTAGHLADVSGHRNFSDAAGTQSIPMIVRRAEDSDSTPRSMRMDRPRMEETQSGDTTPTPSGASTPKNRKNIKNKNKKKGDSLRKTSLATAIDSKMQSEKDDDNSDAASVVTTINRNENKKGDVPDGVSKKLPLDATAAQKQRDVTEQAATQASSEPSFTLTENVATRLPVQERSEEAECAQPEVIGNERPGLDETDLSTTSDSKVSATEGSTNLLPTEDVQDYAPFREDQEAQKEAQAEGTDEHVAEATSTEVVNQPATNVETPSKSEVDHGDDSFHTASGSPGSDTAVDSRKEGTTSEAVSKLLAIAGVQDDAIVPPSKKTDDLEQLESVASPEVLEPSASSKSDNKVHIPQFRSKPKVTISTTLSDTKPEGLQSETLATSGNGNVPQTPAFVTAPNTPAVLQDASNENVPKPTATSSKKTEKPKGPAQTESLSLFGKKKEKKSRPKKGTLKGKPNQKELSDVGSGSSSRIVSRVGTPNNEANTQGSESTAELEGGEDMLRSDSKYQNDARKQSNVKPGAGTEAAEDTHAASAPQEETPSKKKGSKLGNILSGIFGGGQQSQAPPKETKSGKVTSSKNRLTDSKAQGRPQGTEIKQADAVIAGMTHTVATVENGDGGKAFDIISSQPHNGAGSASESTYAIESILRDSVIEGGVEHEVGLGISNIAAGQPANQEIEPTTKKKIHRVRGKKKASDADTSDHSTPATPSQTPAQMFHFRGSVTPPSDEDDNRSDTTSHTIPEEKVSSNTQSPAVSTPAKKLMARQPRDGHLVEAKKPTWKNKKRIPSSRTPETNADEEVTLIVSRLNDSSDASEQTSESGNATPSSENGSKPPKKIFVYVGAGLRDEVEDSQRDEPTNDREAKEKLHKLAKEELKRKHDIASGSSLSAD